MRTWFRKEFQCSSGYPLNTSFAVAGICTM